MANLDRKVDDFVKFAREVLGYELTAWQRAVYWNILADVEAAKRNTEAPNGTT